MAEEQTNVQEQMMDEFFSDKNGLEEDVSTSDNSPGSERDSESLTAEGGNKKDKGNEEEVDDQTGDLEKKKGEGDEDVGDDKDKGKKDSEVDPDSAEAMLFDKDDKGNLTFNVEKALELAKGDGKTTEGGDKTARDVIANTQQEKTLTPDEEIKQRIEKRQESRKQMQENLTSYKNLLFEALNNGYEGQDAVRYADTKIQELINTQIDRMREEESSQREVEYERRMKDREEVAQMKPRAESILGMLDREMGGNYQKIMIGHAGKDGKFVPGIANNDLNTLFSLMNPGAFNKPAQLKQSYEDWYLRLMSNEKTARWVANFGRMRLLQQSIPKLLEAQRDAASNQKKRIAEGKGKTPSNIQSDHSGGGGQQDDIDKWLGAPPGKSVDFIG